MNLWKFGLRPPKYCPTSQSYSPVELLYVSSPFILSSPSANCLSPVSSSTLFRLVEFQAVPTSYSNGTSRAFERHNLDVYPSCCSSPILVSLRILAQPIIYVTVLNGLVPRLHSCRQISIIRHDGCQSGVSCGPRHFHWILDRGDTSDFPQS